MIRLVGHSNSNDVWIWMGNKSHAPPLSFVRHLFYTKKGFSWKLSMHKETHTPLFSHLEWIKIGWLAFEFKFDLNSSEQPPSFILSCGEDAVKTRSCTILKREEKVGHAHDFLRERVAWESLCAWEKKRKEEKRKETERAQGFSFVSILGFLPRVWEVRRWATSIVNPPNFRESFINLSSSFADDPKHPRSRQTPIEGVRLASAIEMIL